MNNTNRRKGFTLVEIMIVVVIIGLLAAMAIPAFSKVRQQSRMKAVLNNLRQISGAAQQYMLDLGVSECGYTDLVGSSTDNLLHNVAPVAGEDYTSLTGIEQGTTQLTISSVALGGTITFTQ